MVPNGENSFLNLSSSIVSSKFLTYKLTCWFLLVCSISLVTNLYFSFVDILSYFELFQNTTTASMLKSILVQENKYSNFNKDQAQVKS